MGLAKVALGGKDVSQPTHFEIYGDALEALAAFYAAVLGWRIEKAPGVDYWRIALDAPQGAGMRAGGIAFRPAMDIKGWLMFVEVPSVEAALAAAQAHGGTMLRERSAVPRTAWYAVVADPAGNPFGMWQPDATAMPLPIPD